MKNSKRIICLLLALSMIFSLAGCRKTAPADSQISEEVEVIYEYGDETAEETTNEESSIDKVVKPTPKPSVDNSQGGDSSSTGNAQTVEAIKGKNTRLYLGAATVSNGVIPVSDGHLYFSPYNWYNAGAYRQTSISGGYVKLAFTGSSLMMGVDTSNLKDNDPASFKIHAYIDCLVDSGTPAEFTLADLNGGKLTLASGLSAGEHYATIYLAQTATGNAWTDKAPNSLRVNGFYINPGQKILDLADTDNKVLPRRFALYGDSITEGTGVNEGAEHCYAAVLARKMGAEYGQMGNGGLGYMRGGARRFEFFCHIDSQNGFWRYYYSGESRLKNNDINQGFIDGDPDAVFVNMGTNDSREDHVTETDLLKKYVSAFLPTIRSAVADDTEIFMIVPFNFGRIDNLQPRFKNAIFSTVEDYLKKNPDYKKMHIIDLGAEGYTIVKENSTDSIHPDKKGGQLLTNKLLPLINKYMK